MDKPKILVADDDESVVKLITMSLEKEGYEIITAYDGKKAVELEEKLHPDLVILDVNMPGINGFEVLNIIREKRREVDYLPIIFVCGTMADKRAVSAMQLGADDFIRKPFEPKELVARVKHFLKLKSLITSVESLENVLYMLVKSVQVRDFYTAGHSHRVGELAQKIGRRLNITSNELAVLRKSAMLHDVGKLGISDNILNKPGKLLSNEYEIIKEHPARGVEICNYLHLGGDVLSIIRHHHEKLDGTGYPDGLKATHINKLVRIATVADMYDAITTKRPYHPARPPEEALSILKKDADDGKVDKEVVVALEVIVKEEVEEKKKEEERESQEQGRRN
jgi:putative two-component system response regulator